MKKNYIVDTNVLLDNPDCIKILRNGEENEIYIPYIVLLELQKLKSEKRLSYIVSQALTSIEESDFIHFIKSENVTYESNKNDLIIIEDIKKANIKDPILITNDKALRIISKTNGIQSEQFADSLPFKSESELYTGFIEDEKDIVNNCFMWKEGKPVFYGYKQEPRVIDYEYNIWGETVKPKNIYQNLAMDLLMNDDIDVVSIQSNPGYGKSYLSLAAAFTKVFQVKKNKFKKIFFLKPTVEIGDSLGFLPGDLNDKLFPYMKYMYDLVWKLYSLRTKNNKILQDGSTYNKIILNTEYIEILPVQYIRGMNLENCILIIDEAQNLNRLNLRSILSRCCDNVKAIVLGDINQIDNAYLNKWNNGLNWVVKSFFDAPNYAHLVLKGNKSRGPITDLVIKSGL